MHERNLSSTNKKQRQLSLESQSEKDEGNQNNTLNIIIKSDVHGSMEAILHSIDQLQFEHTSIHVIHSGTGSVNESDVMLAQASQALLIAFRVAVSPEAQKTADEENLDIKSYDIIYNIVNDLQAALKGRLEIEYEEVEVGQVEVRDLFKFSKVGIIAGCYVTSGTVQKNNTAKIIRDGNEIFSGPLKSLKHFKDDVSKVAQGYECGIVLKDFPDIQKDDIILFFELKEKKETTS
ncbi:MAG: hypothetical protein HRT90_09320 [Candidatus Margulisbacteria bacterium]|nr:hypothetical protein [Candidatus Margulisiibacteriota bacterium]